MRATAYFFASLEQAGLLVTAIQLGRSDVTTLARTCQSIKPFSHVDRPIFEAAGPAPTNTATDQSRYSRLLAALCFLPKDTRFRLLELQAGKQWAANEQVRDPDFAFGTQKKWKGGATG